MIYSYLSHDILAITAFELKMILIGMPLKFE